MATSTQSQPTQEPVQPVREEPREVQAVRQQDSQETISLLSFIFSLVSVVISFLAIPGLILGIIGLRHPHPRRWMAITGTAVSGAIILIWTLIIFFVAIALVTNSGNASYGPSNPYSNGSQTMSPYNTSSQT